MLDIGLSSFENSNNNQSSGKDDLALGIMFVGMVLGFAILFIALTLYNFTDLIYRLFLGIACYGVCSLIINTVLKVHSEPSKALWKANALVAIVIGLVSAQFTLLVEIMSFLFVFRFFEFLKTNRNKELFDLSRCKKPPIWMISIGISILCLAMGIFWVLY